MYAADKSLATWKLKRPVRELGFYWFIINLLKCPFLHLFDTWLWRKVPKTQSSKGKYCTVGRTVDYVPEKCVWLSTLHVIPKHRGHWPQRQISPEENGKWPKAKYDKRKISEIQKTIIWLDAVLIEIALLFSLLLALLVSNHLQYHLL